MSAFWVAATPNEQTGHDTEAAALAHASWLVTSRAATEAVVYEIELGESA